MSGAVEALLFGRGGTNPVQVSPTIDFVNWRLNNVGVARLFMYYRDSKCLPQHLEFGNLVLLRFGNGLRHWGGVIDAPRRRTPSGVWVTAYTGAHLLSWRDTLDTETYDSEAPGTIFQGLIEHANAVSHTGITIGTIYAEGTARSEEYHRENVLTCIEKLAHNTGEEWDVVPRYSAGHLDFEALWWSARGADLSDRVLFAEDRNLQTPINIDEQGPIVARYTAIGSNVAGAAWNDRARATEVDAQAQSEWGYRELTEVFTDVSDQETIDAIAAARLAELSAPRLRYSLMAINTKPAEFGEYWLGDTVTVQAALTSRLWAVESAVRITGIEWTPDGACRLEAV